MYLKYADFIFKLVSPEPNNLAEPIGTDKSFFLDDSETYLPDFVVDIETKKIILDQDCTKLAAHPKAPWELFKKDGCYFIVSANKKEDLPNCTIKFDAQIFSIKAYCAKNFTKIIHGKEMLVNPFC